MNPVSKIGANSRYSVFFLAADRGHRLDQITKGNIPKFLLEISPNDRDPLKRTIIGRLVSQIQEQNYVNRAFIICQFQHMKTWDRWFGENRSLINIDLSLVSDRGFSDWPHRFLLMAQKLRSRERAILIPGDKMAKDINLARIISAAENFRDDNTPFLHMSAYPSRQLVHLPTTFTTNRSGLWRAYNHQFNPDERLSVILPLVYFAFKKQVGLSLGSQFVDVNTKQDLDQATRLISRWAKKAS